MKEIPMRFRLPGNPDAQLLKVLGTGRACLGLFAAANALQLGFVHGVPPHVYVQRLKPSNLAAWKNLRPCEPGEAPDLLLRQAPAVQSVFRTMVRPQGAAASDVLQVWLDVAGGSNPPARSRSHHQQGRIVDDAAAFAPWSVRIGPETEVPFDEPIDILVTNPVSFIVQKLLIHETRKASKKAQDVLYIHDTLELFGAALDELRVVWRDQVRPTMSEKTAKRVENTASALFAQVTDTGREAARIPQDRRLTPEVSKPTPRTVVVICL